jgi:hypothetical protein
MQNAQIDTLINELKTISLQIEPLKTKETELRKELLGRLENEGLTSGYSNDIATVSYVTRKSVKLSDKHKILDTLIEKNCVRYFAYDIMPTFEKDIKDGKLSAEQGLFTEQDVTIESSNNITVKFKN